MRNKHKLRVAMVLYVGSSLLSYLITKVVARLTIRKQPVTTQSQYLDLIFLPWKIFNSCIEISIIYNRIVNFMIRLSHYGLTSHPIHYLGRKKVYLKYIDHQRTKHPRNGFKYTQS